MSKIPFAALSFFCVLAACGGGATNATDATSSPGPTVTPTAGPTAPVAAGLQAPSGFTVETVASIPGARELTPLPNGDLLVGTTSSNVYVIPNAESPYEPGAPAVFATIADSEAAGVARA